MSFCCPIHGYYAPVPGVTVALCPSCSGAAFASNTFASNTMTNEECEMTNTYDPKASPEEHHRQNVAMGRLLMSVPIRIGVVGDTDADGWPQ